MAHTAEWNAAYESSPADGDNVSAGAGKIRTLKRDIRERVAKDHYMDTSGTDADHGEHSKVTFQAPIATPSNVANKGFVYGKDASSKIELHWEDEDGDEVQMSSGGKLGAAGTDLLANTGDFASDVDVGASTTRRVAPAGTFVNDGDGTPVCDPTYFDIDSNLAATTWESVGPTGGGADNTWSALDSVPADADWIEVRLQQQGYTTTGGSGSATQIVYARSGASSGAANPETLIGQIFGYAGSAAVGSAGCCQAKIPVSSREFDLYYSTGFLSSNTIGIYLIGWGFNPTS